MKEIINYATTKAEWQEWLEDIENQLLEQGRIVDALLKSARSNPRHYQHMGGRVKYRTEDRGTGPKGPFFCP